VKPVNRLLCTLCLILLTTTAFFVPVPAAAEGARTPDNNGSPDTAVAITSGVPVSESVDRADDTNDYYKIDALAGQTIRVSVDYTTASCDLRINVYTQFMASIFQLGETTGGSSPRGDTGLCSVNGTYYIRVYSNWGATAYTVNVTVATPPELVPGVTATGSLDWNDNRTAYYRIFLKGNQGGSCEAVWICATRTPTNQAMGKRFYDILNFNGTHEYNGSSSSSARMNISAGATHWGWYYYRVYAYQSAVSYSIDCGRYTVACDGDSDYQNATDVAASAHLQGVVGKSFDHYDWYRCPVYAGDNLIVNVSQQGVRYIFNVSIFDSQLRYVAGDDTTPTGGGNPPRYLNITAPSAPADDRYYIAVMAVSIPQDDNDAIIPYWINFSTPNHPPRIKDQFGPITVNEDERFRLNIYDYFSDQDGDSLKVKVTAAHILGSYCQTTGDLDIFGAPNWYGNENAQVIAQDSQFSTTAWVNVTVLPVEDSPYLKAPIPDVSMDQAKSYGPLDLTACFFDNDSLYPPGDRLSFGVFANGSIWVNITAAGKVTLSAPVNFWGTVGMTFSSTDLAGNIATGACRVVVRHVNQPPLVKSQPPELPVNEDETLVFDFSSVFWDPDGDPITLTAAQNMNIDVLTSPADLNVTFRPKPDMSGFFENVMLTATDSNGAGNNYVVVKVTVVPVNDPPRITAFSPPGSVTLTEGDSLDFSVAATDPESASAVNFNWFLDDVKVLSSATTFVYKTNYSSAGDHVIRVTVDDGELATSLAWNVTVRNQNRDPAKVAILAPRPGDVFKEGAPVNFEGNATDPDDDSLTYRWMEGLMELGNGRTVSLLLSIGVHKITLEASDGFATVRSPVVSITVKANSRPGIISFSPVDGKKFDKGKAVTFTVEAMDGDNDALGYCWTENGRVLSTNSSFTLSGLSVGRHRILVTVSDGLATADNTVTIEMVEPKAAGLDMTMLLGIVAVVAVAAGLAAVIFMRRGRKARPAIAPLKQPTAGQ
jgi:hypothetical protein